MTKSKSSASKFIALVMMALSTMCAKAQETTSVQMSYGTNPMLWADVPDPDVIRVDD